FQVRFECREVLLYKLEWKIIYMTSVESEKYDKVFDSVLLPVDAKHCEDPDLLLFSCAALIGLDYRAHDVLAGPAVGRFLLASRLPTRTLLRLHIPPRRGVSRSQHRVEN
ncbi:Histone chaperone ASF1A, partial [Chelonia mydas]